MIRIIIVANEALSGTEPRLPVSGYVEVTTADKGEVRIENKQEFSGVKERVWASSQKIM